MAAAVAAADARCAQIDARGDELALQYNVDLASLISSREAAEDVDDRVLAEVIDMGLAFTEEVVVSLEQGAAEDTGLADLADQARTEVMPMYEEFLGRIVARDFDGMEDYANQMWPRMSVFIDDLDRLGFDYCFQERTP